MANGDFFAWLDSNIEQLPTEVVAVNFNLYEGVNQTYDIQLIGTDIFDEADYDWACEEIFTTGENVFRITRTNDIEDWKDGLSFIIEMINKYFENGIHANVLKQLRAVGVGFVDGDIEILHQSE